MPKKPFKSRIRLYFEESDTNESCANQGAVYDSNNRIPVISTEA